MDIQNPSVEHKYMECIGFNPMKSMSELWAVLNLNVTGSGRNQFDAAQELNGLDVWRRIDVFLLLHSPAKCKHIGEMSDHLEAWEMKIDYFVILGGQNLEASST